MPLRITVELIPQGDENRKFKIGELYIINDGSGTHESGNYKFKLEGPTTGGDLDIWRSGEYKNYQRNKGYWSLIKEILKSVETDHQQIND